MIDDFYDYFHKRDSYPDFAFFKVPQFLFRCPEFEGLSADAINLYTMILERLSLSLKNSWADDEDRVYIKYSVRNIMKDLHCGSQKAEKLLAELESRGMICRIAQGKGRANRIYPRDGYFLQESTPWNPFRYH